MENRSLQTTDFDISQEMRLLLLCCTDNPSAREYEKIQELICSKPDWNVFSDLIVRHRVYSIVYKNLKNAGYDKINQNGMSELEKKDRQSRMKIILQYVPELTRLMNFFTEQGIRAISIKGPVLSLVLYDDISMRMSKDLDILVCQADVAKAERILLKEGYTKDGKVTDLTDKQRAVLLKTTHHFAYINKKTGMNVEIHWKFNYESYNFDFEEMWAERAAVALNGGRINVLSQEENFLYLVFHGSKHIWARLKWLCDIAVLLKKGNLNWGYISGRAKKLGIEHLLAQTLILSGLLFGTDPHYELFEKKILYQASRLAKIAMYIIISMDYDPAHPGLRFYQPQMKYLILWNSGLFKKLSFVKFLFYPTENDFAKVKLADRYFTMYFFVRLFHVLKRKWHTFVLRDENV